MLNGEIPEPPLVGIALDLLKGSIQAKAFSIRPEFGKQIIQVVILATGKVQPRQVGMRLDPFSEEPPGMLVRSQKRIDAACVRNAVERTSVEQPPPPPAK